MTKEYTDRDFELDNCQHGQEDGGRGYGWWEYDARGIELCKVCDKCQKHKLKKYRPEVLGNPSYEYGTGPYRRVATKRSNLTPGTTEETIDE